MAITAKEQIVLLNTIPTTPKPMKNVDIKARQEATTVPSNTKSLLKCIGINSPKNSEFRQIHKATKIKKSILQKVYDKGLPAWATGHRVGVAHQWATGRLTHSLL